MAKKYLLYIHNPKFNEEPEKSDLVNLLLERHYDIFQPGTLVEDINVVGSREAQAALEGDSPFKACRHSADPRFCKFAKPGKPCK